MDNERNMADRPNIHQRLNAIRMALIEKGPLEKDGNVSFGNTNYDYVTHDAVIAWINVELAENGVEIEYDIRECNQDGNRTEMKVDVTYVNIDNPQKDEITFKGAIGYGIDTSDKGPAKALTSAVKNAHLKQFSLNSFDDPGGELVEHEGAVSIAETEALRETAEKTQKQLAESDKKAIARLRDDIAACATPERLDDVMKSAKALLKRCPPVTKGWVDDLEKTARNELLETEE